MSEHATIIPTGVVTAVLTTLIPFGEFEAHVMSIKPLLMTTLHRTHAILFVLFGVTCAACSSPAAPAPSSSTPTGPSLRIVGDPVIDVTRGVPLAVSLEERDAEGRIVTQPVTEYAWSSDSPSIVIADGGILRASSGLGEAIVTAQSPRGPKAEARVWVQKPPHEPSTFRITLLFDSNVPEHMRALMRAGAERWQEVVRDELPAVRLDGHSRRCGEEQGNSLPPMTGIERGTRIIVRYRPNPEKSQGSSGGVCLARPLPHPTSLVGVVTIDPTEDEASLSSRYWTYLARHEIGHALGLVGVIPRPQASWFDEGKSLYKGPLGLEGFRRLPRWQTSELRTNQGHWIAIPDVLGGLHTEISTLSVGVLMDMGYPAAWYGAGQ